MKLKHGLTLVLFAALATCAIPGVAQYVAPAVQPVFAGPGGSPVPVSSANPLPVTGGGGASATFPPLPLQVTTPGPAPTDATDTGIRVHISGGSPAPGPTSTIAAAVPIYVDVGPSPGAQSINNGGFAGSVDSNGHRPANICSPTSAACAGMAQTSNNALLSGIVAMTKTNLTAASGTCTLLSASASVVFIGVIYPMGASQTGTLTIYDESSATCTAANAFYSSVARASTATAISPLMDYAPIKMSSGITYKWTTAAEAGNVELLTL